MSVDTEKNEYKPVSVEMPKRDPAREIQLSAARELIAQKLGPGWQPAELTQVLDTSRVPEGFTGKRSFDTFVHRVLAICLKEGSDTVMHVAVGNELDKAGDVAGTYHIMDLHEGDTLSYFSLESCGMINESPLLQTGDFLPEPKQPATRVQKVQRAVLATGALVALGVAVALSAKGVPVVEKGGAQKTESAEEEEAEAEAHEKIVTKDEEVADDENEQSRKLQLRDASTNTAGRLGSRE